MLVSYTTTQTDYHRFLLDPSTKQVLSANLYNDLNFGGLQPLALFISSLDRVIVLLLGIFNAEAPSVVVASLDLTSATPKIKYHESWSPFMMWETIALGVFASESVWYVAYTGTSLGSMDSNLLPIKSMVIFTSYQPDSCEVLPPVIYQSFNDLTVTQSISTAVSDPTSTVYSAPLIAYPETATDLETSARSNIDASCIQLSSVFPQEPTLPVTTYKNYVVSTPFLPRTTLPIEQCGGAPPTEINEVFDVNMGPTSTLDIDLNSATGEITA